MKNNKEFDFGLDWDFQVLSKLFAYNEAIVLTRLDCRVIYNSFVKSINDNPVVAVMHICSALAEEKYHSIISATQLILELELISESSPEINSTSSINIDIRECMGCSSSVNKPSVLIDWDGGKRYLLTVKSSSKKPSFSVKKDNIKNVFEKIVKCIQGRPEIMSVIKDLQDKDDRWYHPVLRKKQNYGIQVFADKLFQRFNESVSS